MWQWRPGCVGLLLVALAGCPIQATQEIPCQSSVDCPRGWLCQDLTCQPADVTADAGPSDGVSGDGLRRDAVASDRPAGSDAGGRDRSSGSDSAAPRDAARRDSALRPDSARVDSAVRRDSATPRDAGATDTSCGSITFLGTCQGDLALWCDDGVLVVDNCASDYGGATCGLYDCTQEAAGCYGYWCVARASQPCNVDPYALGCDIRLNHGCYGDICTPTASCDPASSAPSCSGNRISFCPYGRVWDYDCSVDNSAPYVCQTAAGGYDDCLGTAGGECDPDRIPAWDCAAGYTCTNNVCN